VRGFASDENKFRKPSSMVWEPLSVNSDRPAGPFDGERAFSNDRNSNGGDRWAEDRSGEGVLRRKMPDEDYENQGAKGRSLGGRDILDAVEANQPDTGNKAIKSRGQD
jgi:hypothetical protein